MKYCVIGAGSVGGYFGGRLQQAGNDVVFLVRENRKRQLDSEGLKIRSYLGDADLKVKAESDERSTGKCDVVIIAIRNFHLDDKTMSKISYFAKEGASFITMLNGVEHLERLLEFVPKERIIGGSAFIDSRLGNEGEIVHRGQDPTIMLGSLDNRKPEVLDRAVEDFRRAGIRITLAEDLMQSLWRKYTFVLLGTLTGVTGTSIGTIVSNRWLNRTLEQISKEIQQTAKNVGVRLTDRMLLEMLEEIRGMRKEWKSLLTEDIESGRENELESLWGYIIRKAEHFGTEVPLSNLCYGVLKIRTHPEDAVIPGGEIEEKDDE